MRENRARSEKSLATSATHSLNKADRENQRKKTKKHDASVNFG